jgi:DNA-binding LytR/AlgR family response regulator
MAEAQLARNGMEATTVCLSDLRLGHTCRSGLWEMSNRFSTTVVVKVRGHLIFLKTAEILWVESHKNYLHFNTRDTVYKVRGLLKDVYGQLMSYQFTQIHRSFVVNVNQIRELIPCNSKEFVVVLRCGKELPCSRSYHGMMSHLVSQELIWIQDSTVRVKDGKTMQLRKIAEADHA